MSALGATTVPRAVWQVSAGPAARSYVDVLFRQGVALIGPGDAGRWTSERDDDEFDGSFVRRFASEVASGDVFLMRTGVATIAALGLVAGEYLYVNAFDDVNGWDLQHARRVRWCRLPEQHVFTGSAFGANPPRCSRVWNPDVVEFAERFLNSPPTYWQTAPLPELPMEEPALDHVPDNLLGIVGQVADLVPLFQDGQAFGEPPSEDELIAHFVVPFLRAVGWPPERERIAVKWRYIDVAVFRALPRTPENCHLVVEAKRLGAGVEGALEQAKGYVEALGIPRDVIVTDGIRYRMYAGGHGFEPVAYANLARLKKPAADLFARIQRP
jgi:hypothetical protein